MEIKGSTMRRNGMFTTVQASEGPADAQRNSANQMGNGSGQNLCWSEQKLWEPAIKLKLIQITAPSHVMSKICKNKPRVYIAFYNRGTLTPWVLEGIDTETELNHEIGDGSEIA